MRLALAVTLALVIASPAWAAERPPAALYQRWLHANEDCRGGTEPKAVAAACECRSTVDDEMAASYREPEAASSAPKRGRVKKGA